MFDNIALAGCKYLVLVINMKSLIILAVCAVYPAQSIILQQKFGPVHIHVKPKGEILRKFNSIDEGFSKKAKKYVMDNLYKLDIDLPKSEHYLVLDKINTSMLLTLYDISIRGFNSATVENLIISIPNGRVDFNINIPALLTNCSVFTHGSVEGNTFAILGNVSAIMGSVNINGSASFYTLFLEPQLYVYLLKDLDLKIIIDNVKVSFKIVEELAAFKVTLASFLNHSEDDIVEALSRRIIMGINSKLINYVSNDNFEFKETDPRFYADSVMLYQTVQ